MPEKRTGRGLAGILVFYAANLLAVLLTLAFADLSESLKLTLALWILALTPIVSYIVVKHRGKGRGK
jgi:hypothetical protein